MVSIIVPIYNSMDFIEKCLTSIQQQTYTDFEVLCVDDGSTDASSDIIKRYVSQDKRFIYLSKKHSNAGEARNVGIAASRGNYLLFLDSDDFFSPDLIDKVRGCAVKTDADITVFQYKLFYEQTGRISSKSFGIHTKRRNTFNLIDYHEGKFEFTNIAVWNKLYKADFIKKNNLFFQSHMAINDVFFSWCALILAEKIALCRHVGIFYRINSGMSISDNLVRTSECFFKAFQEVNEYIKSIGRWNELKNDIIVAERKQFEEFYDRLSKNKNLCKISYRFKVEMDDFFKLGFSV